MLDRPPEPEVGRFAPRSTSWEVAPSCGRCRFRRGFSPSVAVPEPEVADPTPSAAADGAGACVFASGAAVALGRSHRDSPVRVLKKYSRSCFRDLCTIHPGGSGSSLDMAGAARAKWG